MDWISNKNVRFLEGMTWRLCIWILLSTLVSSQSIPNSEEVENYTTEKNTIPNTISYIKDEGIPRRQMFKNLLSTILSSIFSLSEILLPYLTFDIPGIDINWEAMENATNTFRAALARADPSVNTAGAAGMLAVGIGAVASPYIVKVAKAIFTAVAEFFDNLYYVATGEALRRQAVPDELWDELLQAAVEHMAY